MWADEGVKRQTYSFGEAAELLGYGHYTFLKLLRENEILWSGNKPNIEYIRKGYLTEALYQYKSPRCGYSQQRQEVRVTSEGIAFFKKLLAE
jgi:phage antirepressor YoqD-like protein